MNDLIKAKLNELFLSCLENGFHFNYSAHVNSLTVMPIDFNGIEDYTLFLLSLDDSSMDDVLDQLDLAIKIVKGE